MDGIRVTVWDEEKIVAEGMGGIAGVGQEVSARRDSCT